MIMRIRNLLYRIFYKLRYNKSDIEELQERGLQIGKNFRNHSSFPFDALFPWLISVGENVCFSANVKILAHDTSTEYVNGHTKIGIVEIGDNVYIGYGSTIMCNVRIGNNAIIGAGSVVTKDVPAGTVYGGNPAHFICTTEEFMKKHKTMMSEVPVYSGPCQKWWDTSPEEQKRMRKELKDTFGYMK